MYKVWHCINSEAYTSGLSGVDNQSIIGFIKDANFYYQMQYLLSVFYCSYKAFIITLLFI